MSKNEATALMALTSFAVGIIGFLASLGWSKAIGSDLDREKVIFLAKMWGGIVAFGVFLDLIR